MEKSKKTEVDQYFESLRLILQNSPKNIAALTQIGVLEFEYYHEHKKAVDYLQKAIHFDPLNVEARFWLAACLYHDYSEYEGAEKVLREALEIDPHRPDCLSLLASIIWHAGRSLEIAINYLRTALENAPDWPLLRHKLATLLLELHQTDLAEQEVHKALSFVRSTPLSAKNEVENYYENTVTGRAWPNIKDEFSDLLERINQQKTV